MIPELGHFALIIALFLAVAQSIVPLAGSFTGNRAWMGTARPLAWGQLTFLGLAFLCLIEAFLTDDFSVLYVASNSNTLMPDIYKVSAVWGAHEGSLLLWALLLGAWGAAVAAFSYNLPERMVARVIAVIGMISIGFVLFMLLTSNPFDRIFPPPLEGRDLNPLLQDPALAIHPPMLYMGYVGFSVAFAFAIAALISGKLDAAWARWSRPWTTVAWIFLTIGIALGSWWAYYELGWGGWWFWDPVENASFMPWLMGTALMHSLAVSEKRGAFKSWTVLLALATFSLSLLGTFLVRSGVLTSVHAFATDPERGRFILAFLCVVIGGSLSLYAWRAPQVATGGRFGLLSRESFLLLNNLLLALLTAFILIGTLAPLIYEAFGWGKISVGKPWFDIMFVAIMPFLALAMGLGVTTRWKQDVPARLLGPLLIAFVLAVALTAIAVVALPIEGEAWIYVPFGVLLAAWLLTTHLVGMLGRFKHKRGVSGVLGDLGGSRSYYGMLLAHLGVAMFILGATIVTNFEAEQDLRMSPGDRHEVSGYSFVFEGVEVVPGPNYRAQRGRVLVFDEEPQRAIEPFSTDVGATVVAYEVGEGDAIGVGDVVAQVTQGPGIVYKIRLPNDIDLTDMTVAEVLVAPGEPFAADQPLIRLEGERAIAVLQPEKRIYIASGRSMTEAAIDAGLFRDLYVSLGEPVSEKGDWSLRIYHKPYVRWIWLGAIFMALGGALAVSDRRYRSARRRVEAPVLGVATARA